MRNLLTYEQFINEGMESINEEIKKGIFKGYDDLKGKVIIPLVEAPKDLTPFGMPKFTVGVGLELNKTFKFPHDYFDLALNNGMVCVLINQKGKFRLKVNIENGNYTLEDFISNIKNAVKNYLKW